MSEYSFKNHINNRPIFAFLFVSILIHLFAVSIVQLNKSNIQTNEETIEVELLELKPIVVDKQPIESKTVSTADKITSVQTTKEPAEKPAPQLEKPSLSLQSKLTGISKNSVSQSDSTVSNSPLQIPKIAAPQSSVSENQLTTNPVENKIWTKIDSSVSNQSRRNKPNNVPVDELVQKDIANEAASVTSKTSQLDDGKNESNSERSQFKGPDIKSGTTIEGEISQRKVIFRPKTPVLNLDRDITITLKFTVLPNGEVDQVFPYEKAEPELERIAIEMLHKFRFEPLFSNNKVQNGIIHFTINRKPINK